MKSCICVDITRLLHKREFCEIVDHYIQCEELVGRRRIALYANGNLNDYLLQEFNIEYRAPYDARETNLSDNSASNLVFEHIPREDIVIILKECYRILKSDAIMSVWIDYADHFSYFDPRISQYNFFKYSDSEWERYDCARHYQNRLRHCDYVKLFKDAGFSILSVHTEGGTDEDKMLLRKIKLADRFREYDEHDLLARSGYFVVTK